MARMPPWIFGWSVLTRPPSISGSPVASDTGTTGIFCSSRARAVPPVGEDLEPDIVQPAGEIPPRRLCPKTEIKARRFIVVFCVHSLPPKVVRDRADEQTMLYRVQPFHQTVLCILRAHRDRLLRHHRPRHPPPQP